MNNQKPRDRSHTLRIEKNSQTKNALELKNYQLCQKMCQHKHKNVILSQNQRGYVLQHPVIQ